ncbi:MAG: cellulase family glycosylhydrolase, partial [Erysipelotrichaceae bacterium]|nr:cellulase family glycosylhydrolase [Erysipelotrichaceae bacterium]
MKRFKGFQRGINLGGWLSQFDDNTKEYFDTFIVEQDIKNIAEMGLDHVRLPIDYSIIEDEQGNEKIEGYRYIDHCVQWCKQYGLHLILDLHHTFGYTFDPLIEIEDREAFFKEKALQDRFVTLWKRLAKRYGNDKDIAFELLNEVISGEIRNEWNAIALRAIQEIHKITPETYVILGGVYYNNVRSVPDLPA